ncbi:hypothetical protein Pla108_32540 [Botrimarina colliarenosi]|uniref:PEP-CTERM protein-sorting domain-containing protein n=1 Tax=Botrimarina colliarenosi TaxID=2528001 RepID=A0A5C6A9Y3_9BACT|nr:hypothetical protein [Botrimarina colliarenosi]TWT96167.1 hypothetical protein Pla108_32540 [Botrimarina colliarenosi]
MNATIQSTFSAWRCAQAMLAVLVTAGVSPAATFTIVDGEGFESPSYSTTFIGTGQLEGQFASTTGGFGTQQWLQSPLAGAGTAVVQSSVVASGSQAVEVNRAANSDDRWAVPVSGYPSMQYICIEWDMRVDQTFSSTGFGPFFGVEANDDDGNPVLRAGMLGVDAATGEVLYGDSVSGLIPTPGGETVAFDAWNSYRMIFDYSVNMYHGFLNGVPLFTTDFEFAGVDQFTDADIAALAASLDAESQSLTGTAYFDNFMVFETSEFDKQIPEPSAAVAAVMGLVAMMVRRRV